MLAEEQAPLIMADEFFGAPGYSSPRYEVDFALTKPRCDMLLNATAYAPGGRPSPRVPVGVKIDGWSKVLDVVGERVWLQRGATLGPSAPEPFVTKPITYEHAFGGVDNLDPDEGRPTATSPTRSAAAGTGSATRAGSRARPCRRPRTRRTRSACPGATTGPWLSASAGATGCRATATPAPTIRAGSTTSSRSCRPTSTCATTRRAPEDQQIDHPKGGEEVRLVNLTPEGTAAFRLPTGTMPIEFYYKTGARRKFHGIIDTLVFEPDLRRFTMSWRASLPLRRSLHEIRLMVAGPVPPDGYVGPASERTLGGRRHYRSLSELIAANQASENDGDVP